MSNFHTVLVGGGFLALGIAALYPVLNLLALVVWRIHRGRGGAPSPEPVTLLKPLCGGEPGLYEDLRTFCLQDYPNYQIVFGLRDACDPAFKVAERLQIEYPDLSIEIVVDPRRHGNNYKVSNLINMVPHARHPVLVVVDSDAFVESDYLTTVTTPMRDRSVGLVTCVYRSCPTRGVWSRLGAMYINEWYVPTVLMAWLFGHRGYVSGQTMVLRRETLDTLGGFETITDHLAEDYRLGELVRGLGLKVVLSPYWVRGECHEPSFASLVCHEVRWMRTLRTLRPRSFRWLFLTFTLPLVATGSMLLSIAHANCTPAYGLLALALISRLTLHWAHRTTQDGTRRTRDGAIWAAGLWLMPVRDVLLCWVWFRTFWNSRVIWRGHEFDVDRNGLLRHLS